MMTFSSSADLLCLHLTDPAQPVINKLVNGLFSETLDTHNDVIALMEHHDTNHTLSKLCNAEDVSLEGIINQGGMYLVALQTDYDYGLVIVIPDEDWLTGELRRLIELNIQH